MHHGLRCDRYDKSVDEQDSCPYFEISARYKVKEIESQLSQAKELIKEMRDALAFYAFNVTSVWDCDGEHLLEDQSEASRKILKENTDKIKALLGE